MSASCTDRHCHAPKWRRFTACRGNHQALASRPSSSCACGMQEPNPGVCQLPWRSLQVLPVVKDTLGECLTTGLLAQSCDETERLGNGKVCLDLQQWSSLTRIFLEHLTTTPM